MARPFAESLLLSVAHPQFRPALRPGLHQGTSSAIEADQSWSVSPGFEYAVAASQRWLGDEYESRPPGL